MGCFRSGARDHPAAVRRPPSARIRKSSDRRRHRERLEPSTKPFRDSDRREPPSSHEMVVDAVGKFDAFCTLPYFSTTCAGYACAHAWRRGGHACGVATHACHRGGRACRLSLDTQAWEESGPQGRGQGDEGSGF